MELIDLNAKTRETKGKGAARKMRAANAIPAIVYGADVDPVKLSVNTTEFDKVVRDHGTSGVFFNLTVDGGTKKMVMLKDVQMDAFQLNYLHIDFHEVDMDHKVAVWVPVETAGKCPGVKEGGMVQVIRRELEILCKPQDTPENVVVDISELNIGDSVHVEDIKLDGDIDIPHEVNFTVVTVVPPTTSSDGVEEEDEEDTAEA